MYRIKLNKQAKSNLPAVATIGNFDGLHVGHMKLFDELNKVAEQYNYQRIAITFEPLPLEYFSDRQKLTRLTRLGLLRDKFNILSTNCLADELIILHFNQNIANLSADDFIVDYLINKLGVAYVVVGHDFRFGKKALGTVDDFIKHGINNIINGISKIRRR